MSHKSHLTVENLPRSPSNSRATQVGQFFFGSCCRRRPGWPGLAAIAGLLTPPSASPDFIRLCYNTPRPSVDATISIGSGVPVWIQTMEGRIPGPANVREDRLIRNPFSQGTLLPTELRASRQVVWIKLTRSCCNCPMFTRNQTSSTGRGTLHPAAVSCPLCPSKTPR